LYHKIKKAIIINQTYATPKIISQKNDDELNSQLMRIESSLKNYVIDIFKRSINHRVW